MNTESEPIPVFVPALGTILVAAEDAKGEPLASEEVAEIRDNAVCIMMDPADAAKMVESRGYIDVDPENCWHDWQMLRRELGRKPDLNPGARVDYFDNSDSEYQLTIAKAQETLGTFREMSRDCDPWAPLIKTELSNLQTDGRCFVWLNNVQFTSTGFLAQLFEIPPALQGFAIGDEFEIIPNDVLDWMINDGGTLHGGFSLRYHRERLPEHERAAFDQHIGVVSYA